MTIKPDDWCRKKYFYIYVSDNDIWKKKNEKQIFLTSVGYH